jgi:sarcosine oxidase subunit delta
LKDRPTDDAGEDAFHDYVYLRANPRGEHRELWQHEAGCRRWLVVTRSTATHDITSIVFASDGEKPL